MLDTAQTLLHLTLANAQDRLNRYKVKPSDDEKALLATLQERGFVVIPHYYDAEKCAQLRHEVDRLIQQYPATTMHLPDDARVHGAERVSGLIKEFHDDPRLHHLAEAFHQAPTLNLFTLAARIRATPGGLGSGGGWHRDSVHQRQFKAIIYLSDVSEGEGPYQYVANTHRPAELVRLVREGLVKFNQNRLTDADVQRILQAHPGHYRLYNVTGPAGTLVITDTRGIHRGQPLQFGSRYALTNYVFARHHLTPRSESRFRALFVDRPVAE